jgi:tetratricopeptide (TPR) repeat protein
MKSCVFLLLGFLFFISAARAQDESRLNTLLKEADSFIAKNDLTQALAKTKEALYIAPDYHPALQKQINILFLMKDEKESVRLVEEAIHKYPDNPVYYYLRGVINNSREKYSRALDDFSKAIELNPGDLLYRCYLGRGVSYFKLLEYDEALSDLTASLEHNDTIPSAYYSRGMVNYEIRDYPSAINDFKKALELSPGNAELYFNLGMSYFRLNEKDKACPNFNKSCSLGNVNACKMTLMECAKAIPSLP